VDFQVVVSPRAARELRAITAYIARDNPDRAASFGKELLDRIKILADFPQLGSPFGSSTGLRKLVSEPYLIIYEVDHKARRVNVASFRHGSRR
jgi:plasmid stabilization system protein ParE